MGQSESRCRPPGLQSCGCVGSLLSKGEGRGQRYLGVPFPDRRARSGLDLSHVDALWPISNCTGKDRNTGGDNSTQTTITFLPVPFPW